MNLKIVIVKADYNNEKHSQDIPFLLNEYACEPMGDGSPLSETTMANLSAELSKIP